MNIDFFNLAYNDISYPIFILNSENKLVWVNKKFSQVFNINKTNIETNSTLFFRDDGSLKSSYKLKNTYYLLSSSIIKYEKTNYTLVSFLNITKRKKLEKDLEFEQGIFETLCNQLPEGIALYDTKLIYTNLNLRKNFKYTKITISDKNFFDLISSEDKELFSKYLENLELNKNKEFIFKMQRSNNSQFWASVKTIVLEKYDGSTLYLSLVEDVTTEKMQLDKLNILANYDKLTNAINRRRFDELLLSEYKRNKRYNVNICSIFFDIDHFKNINDKYGHDVGDSVLIELSLLIKNNIRDTDIFARWGGEEFILLLPETTLVEAEIIAEKLRELIQMHKFKVVSNVTISLGVTKMKSTQRLNTFIKRLDNALYLAKQNGRNRFEVIE